MDKYYTITEVAAAIGLHPETVREYCREIPSRIGFSRFGRSYRFTQANIDEFLKKHSSEAMNARDAARLVRMAARAR